MDGMEPEILYLSLNLDGKMCIVCVEAQMQSHM